MMRSLVGALAVGAVTLFVACRGSQPEAKPTGAEPEPNKEVTADPKKDAPRCDKKKTPSGKTPPPGKTPPLLPPFLVDQLELDEDQAKQVAELEKDFYQRLMKILTPAQQKKLQAFPPKGLPNMKDLPGGKGGFPPNDDFPSKDGFPPKDKFPAKDDLPPKEPPSK
jgi:hypothetical protein